ncbi:MAG: hypothetical protein MR791_02715 [Bacteroidales bacterium]|nr:hypothetical protein [Bacteroidales bacterium]
MEYKELGKAIKQKTDLLDRVLSNTKETFALFRDTAKEIIDALKAEYPNYFFFNDKSEAEFEIRFGTDILLFSMHTNVFEFSRMHEVMKLPYIKEDKERSFSGMINIYNFLTDSFDYNRDYDIGYLIGRVFINKEKHYFIEGKREVGLLYSSFNTSVVDKQSITSIIVSAMEYANNFDLLTPPFDQVKEITVGEIKQKTASKRFITAKRLGFEFQQDKE